MGNGEELIIKDILRYIINTIYRLMRSGNKMSFLYRVYARNTQLIICLIIN